MDAPSHHVPFELRALARAKRYQRWVAEAVRPFMGRRILEVGAGIGNMSQHLPLRERLILTESDPGLLALLQGSPLANRRDPRVTVSSLTLGSDEDAPLAAENLDTIVSFNVLEHIENDGGALGRMAELMRSSAAPGHRRVVSFVPAHDWAFGTLDRAFGHFRRYTAERVRELARTVAPDAELHLRFFNVVGLLGWMLSGKVLRKKEIGDLSIDAFELLCPFVRPVDGWLTHRLKFQAGQSLLFTLTWKAN